ncbi:hypothetical protein GCM10020001_075320 [Nonomuraea salmonea]
MKSWCMPYWAAKEAASKVRRERRRVRRKAPRAGDHRGGRHRAESRYRTSGQDVHGEGGEHADDREHRRTQPAQAGPPGLRGVPAADAASSLVGVHARSPLT